VTSCGDPWRLTEEVAPHREIFLALEGEASRPYNDFVYSDDEAGRHIRGLLFERGAAEYCPPHGRVLLRGVEVMGMIAFLRGDELSACRLRSAHFLTRTGIFREDAGLRDRLRLAGRTLLAVQPDEFYLSRIAVRRDARGGGIGGRLMAAFEEEGARRRCRRFLLEVATGDAAAVRFYMIRGYAVIGRAVVEDPSTLRRLEYTHLAKEIG